MLFFFCQTLQSATIALTLLSLSFMHHVQCSGQNAAETGALNNHLTHPVQRQTTVIEYTVTDTDFRCDKLENDAYCGSGLAQSQVDNELACGTALNKVNMRPECLKNEKGEFCGSVFTQTLAVVGVSVCFDAMDFISDKIDCSKCREQLELLKKSWAVVSIHMLTLHTRIIPDSCFLTIVCGNRVEFALPPNGKCDKHGLTFKVPATVRNNCTDEETARATTCSKAGQSYLDGLLRDNTCKQKHKNTTDLALITCAVNGKRRDSFCFSLFQSGAYSRATMKLNSNCAQEINSTSASCSKICRDTLNETKAELDCCVNIFNGTGIDTNLPGTSNIPRTSPALAYRIWESCGVETPGFCDNKLSGAIPTTYSVQWFSTLMATVAMVTVSMFSMGI